MAKQNQLPVEEVPFELIMREGHGMSNCRGHIDTESSEFLELLKDIKKNGVTTPPMVWAVPGTGDEESGEDLVLLAGYRRHLAMTIIRDEAKAKGVADDALPFSALNVSVFQGNPSEALARNLADNLRHEDVNPADKCSHIAKLHEALSSDAPEGTKWTQGKTANVLNCGQPFVAQCIGIERYCSAAVKSALRGGQINFSHARTLSGAEYRTTNEAGETVPNEELQAEELAKILKGEGIKPPKKKNDAAPRAQDFITKSNVITLMQRAEELREMAAASDGAEGFVVNEQRMADLDALFGLLFLTQSPNEDEGEDRVAVNIDAYLCGTQDEEMISTGLQSVRDEIEERTKKAAERLAKQAEKEAEKAAKEAAKEAAKAAKEAASAADGEAPKKKRRTKKKEVVEATDGDDA